MQQYEYVFQHGAKLYSRVFDSETKTSKLYSLLLNECVPELYIPTKEATEYVSHANNKQHLKKKEFETTKEMKQYLDSNKDLLNIHGNVNPVMKFIRDNFPDTIASTHEFRTHFIDIETRSVFGFPDYKDPKEEITLIQVYDNFEQVYYILGTKEYNNTKTYNYGRVEYIKCDNELDVLNRWFALVKKLDPTILVGFNTFSFDYPYIINRCREIGLKPERLSPIGVIKEKEAETKDGIAYIHYEILGRILLDYRELYLKYSYAKLPKHNLETIVSYELGEGKIDHGEYDSFEEFYKNDYQKFVEYGIKDVELLVALDKKLKMIDTAKFIGYLCGVNVTDVMGTYKQWFSYVYNSCMAIGEILPLSQMYSKEDDVFIGGWVVSNPGKYEWLVSFDFASLYPSEIHTLNLGLDTFIPDKELHEDLLALRRDYFFWYNDKKNEDLCKEKNNNQQEFEHIKFLIENKEHIHSVLVKHNVTASPNGYFYSKEKQGVLPTLLRGLLDKRKEEKKKMEACEKMIYEIEKEISSRTKS